MRIQIKLFLLLVVIAVLPLAALSWRSERATENLGLAMAEYGKAAITQNLETQLRQAVSYSSELLGAQQHQVELALRLQATEIERRLNSPAPADPAPTYTNAAFDETATWPPGTELAMDHAVISPNRELKAVPISRIHQSFFLPSDLDAATARPFIDRLASLDKIYRDIAVKNASLFYWQYLALKNGLHSSYPGHGGYPAGYDPRQRAWYLGAVTADDLVWTPPQLDASTRRLLLTAAMPLRDAGGEISGVTAIDVDILTLLEAAQTRMRLGGQMESYVVQLTDAEGKPFVPGPNQSPTLRVLASSLYRDVGTSWDAQLETQALTTDRAGDLDQIAADIQAGNDGIRQVPHSGKPSLWVYGQLGRAGTALLYIVPVGELESIADRAQESVRQAIVEQVQLAGVASVILIAVVAVLAMLASRTVTSPLRALADAARDLARGNLLARAPVTSRDEVGELATVFNSMVPELKTHIQVQESLDLAREVQQKLLPDEAPAIPGLDVAGHSIYSEAVGGDYYDFMALKDEDGRARLGVVIGDVSGHGVVAALTMMSVRALLRSHAGDGSSLRPVMRAVNRHLAGDATGGRFVTLVYMTIDPETRDVRWISAGHGPILFYDAQTKEFEELAVHDIPLGVRPEWPFHENDRDVWSDFGVIVLGTDGIWETKSRDGKMFGKEGLMDVIAAHAHQTASDICAAVFERLREFSGGDALSDDVTLVIVKFLPKRT